MTSSGMYGDGIGVNLTPDYWLLFVRSEMIKELLVADDAVDWKCTAADLLVRGPAANPKLDTVVFIFQKESSRNQIA